MRRVNMYIYQTLSRRIQIYNVFKCSEVDHYNVFKMLEPILVCLSRLQYNLENFSRTSTWVLVLVLVLVILVLEMLSR